MDWRFTDDRPIWLQLTEQLTRRIITGGLSTREPPAPRCGNWPLRQGSTPTPCSGPWLSWNRTAWLSLIDRRPAGNRGHLCAGRCAEGPGQGSHRTLLCSMAELGYARTEAAELLKEEHL